MQQVLNLILVIFLAMPVIIQCAAAEIIEQDSIAVVAHRGLCGEAPENSLASFANCIDWEIDFIELDVRKTKDEELVVIHDSTIDRTTDGVGRVKDYELVDLKNFNLKDRQGVVSAYKIPTLREVFLLTRNKIKLNIDDKEELFPEIIKIAEEENILPMLLFKSKKRSVIERMKVYGKKINFMPIFVNYDGTMANLASIIQNYEEQLNLVAVELVFENINSFLIKDKVLNFFRNKNISTWVNTLSPELCAGLDDRLSLKHPNLAWGYFANRGFGLIQTDYPKKLKNYLLTRLPK